MHDTLDRYAALMKRKYETGLTESEQKEVRELLAEIDRKFAHIEEPILRDLRERRARRLKGTTGGQS